MISLSTKVSGQPGPADRTHAGLYLSDKEYEVVRQALVSAIPPEVPDDLRNSLKTRIGYGNELAQRRRFKDLRDSLDEAACVVVTKPFLEQVVEMRNYLTHYPAGNTPPMGPAELVYATFRLRAFLCLLLLAEVEITGEEAIEGVRRTRWFRGFVGT